MHLPLDYHAEVVTPSADEQSPLSVFLALAAAAAVGIYLLLQAAFGSWRLASLVFATLPTALVGGLLVIVAGGGDLSLGAAFGLMTVLGVAVRNAVMLVRHLQGLEANASLDAALVVRGTADRAAPVALTALVMAAALLPFAVLGDVAGNEITHSTAAVVIGGLVTSTVLSLFVLPALYLHLAHGAVAARAERAETAPVARPRHLARNLGPRGSDHAAQQASPGRPRGRRPRRWPSPAAARRRPSTTRPRATRGRRAWNRSRAATFRASC